jgi:hypothetical protein
MLRQRCQARINGGWLCGKGVWGPTVYCKWHNAFLAWRSWGLTTKKHGKSIGWAAYDPQLIDWSFVPPSTKTNVVAALFAFPFTVFYVALLGKTPFSVHPLQQLDVALWWSVVIAVQLMAGGNSNTALPKLLLLTAIAKTGLNVTLWRVGLNSTGVEPSLIASVGLLGLAVPPPKGPLRHREADPLDSTHWPPMNVGSMWLKTLSVTCLVVGALYYAATLFEWRTAGGGGGTPAWSHLFATTVVIYVVAISSSNVGSMSTIRRGWHAQTIYHRCVMPNVGKVCVVPQSVGWVAGTLVYLGAEYLMGGAWLLPSVAGSLVGCALAFLGARRRGLRIYPEAVRREGIFLQNDNVLES